MRPAWQSIEPELQGRILKLCCVGACAMLGQCQLGSCSCQSAQRHTLAVGSVDYTRHVRMLGSRVNRRGAGAHRKGGWEGWIQARGLRVHIIELSSVRRGGGR